MEKKIKNVTVFGSGSFGTAMAFIAAQNGHNVRILTRSAHVAESINQNHKNSAYLTDFILPNNLIATTDAKAALENTNYIIHSIPIQSTPEYLEKLKEIIPKDVPIINTSKGIHSETLLYMSEIVPKALGRKQPMAFFSGPSFAKELMMQIPTAVTVASEDADTRENVRALFASPKIRVYTTSDIVGVEVGGALKNIYAIAAGVAEGLGLGMNTMAALVTRSCAEMTKLAVKLGANPITLSGLSGIGDLMLTCFGSLSRNRTVGKRLGQGETLEEILKTSKEVAEGVATTAAAVKLADKLQIELPIVQAVAKLLNGSMKAPEAVNHLMTLEIVEDNFEMQYPKSS